MSRISRGSVLLKLKVPHERAESLSRLGQPLSWWPRHLVGLGHPLGWQLTPLSLAEFHYFHFCSTHVGIFQRVLIFFVWARHQLEVCTVECKPCCQCCRASSTLCHDSYKYKSDSKGQFNCTLNHIQGKIRVSRLEQLSESDAVA